MGGIVDARSSGDVVQLRIAGEFDLVVEPRLRAAAHAALDAGCRLVLLDLAEVSFMDCAGVATLIGCCDLVREAGADLRIIEASAAVTAVLTLTGAADRVPLTHSA